jgi:ABC-type transport system substrate-binding protein
MNIRRILIIAPIVLIVILLQSYFWIPTYEEQTRGNPHRLKEFITASSGDASLLNPILSADSSSSDINSKVFEGLIDYDENLRFRGRLATQWDIFEEAFFYVNEKAVIPEIGKADPSAVVSLLKAAKKEKGWYPPPIQETLNRIRDIEVIPPRTFTLTRQDKGKAGNDQPKTYQVDVNAPARIKLTLEAVDQELFDHLAHILGAAYFKSFNNQSFLTFEPMPDEKTAKQLADEILPAVEHNPVFIFYLRPNVQFHDGHVFDAEDVKFTYDAIMNPRNISPRLVDYEPVKSVEVIDPLTLRITYKRLYSPAVGTWSMNMLPKHLLDQKALEKEARRLGKDPNTFTMRQSAFNRNPIGCGPFRFKTWKSDQYIILERFEDYWEGPPHYHTYAYRIIPDLLTQEMEFYAGTLENYDVQPHQVKRLKNHPEYQSFSGPSFGYTYIGYNMRRKPFDDPKVRRALGMAIDIKKIIKYVIYDQGERITGPFVKQTDYYNHQIEPLPYDPEGALKLLAEAGYTPDKDGWLFKNGKKFEFTLITNNGNPQREEILAIAQNAWKKIGIDVRTDRVEWSVFVQKRINQLDFDAVILGWSMGIDPDLYQIWHSSQTDPFELNFVGFKNNTADKLIVKIRQEYDRQKQIEYCHRLHRIIADQQPYTFLYVRKWTAVLDKRIVIKETTADGSTVYKKITPTKTGSYSFYFNKWIKLLKPPELSAEG